MATTAAKSNSQPAETPKLSDVDELKLQIEALKSDISALTGTVKDIGKARAEAFRSAATEQASAWRNQGEAAVGQARAKGTAYYEQAERSVRDNPAMAVGIAAGVGFLTGLLMRRR